MRIAHVRGMITPPLGTELAGYGPHDKSVAKYDELTFHGICLESEGKKHLLISYDLLGLTRETVVAIRQACAGLIGGTEADVLLTCTHTHGGPHTRYTRAGEVDLKSCQMVIDRTVKAVAALQESDFVETTPYFYSKQCSLNVNRRYCGPENVCRMLCDRRDLLPLADGPCDPEIGMIFFCDKFRRPQEIIVNYAAHPLAAHAGGVSAFSISSDYPGLVRKYLEENTGAGVTFISGAAGNQFPKDSEAGFFSLENIAKPLASETLQGYIMVKRNPEKFGLGENAKVQTGIEPFTVLPRTDVPVRKPMPEGATSYELELQFLTIGDLCLVGVPGEVVAELGLEIKWHSPFRRTFICYNSTDYASYINQANAFVSGGYEAEMQVFDKATGLQMVVHAVEAMNKLKDSLHQAE